LLVNFVMAFLLYMALMAIDMDLAVAAEEAGKSAPSRDQAKEIAILNTLLATSNDKTDLAGAKIAIDRLIDPAINSKEVLDRIDSLARNIGYRFPIGATSQNKLEVLVASLATPGPWNDYRPFTYDLNDPYGRNIKNKLISTYLDSHKGNCVSMPILLVILGQKLGINMALATAPEHILAKFKNDQGQWINIEATSFGTKSDVSYQQDMGISPKAMNNSIYLRPLDRRESIGVMMGTLMEFYGRNGQQQRRIDISRLALRVNSKDTFAMLQIGNAYYKLMMQAKPTASDDELAILRQKNVLWFRKAEALGWVEPTYAQDASYIDTIKRTKFGAKE